jgi:hypothetical protein
MKILKQQHMPLRLLAVQALRDHLPPGSSDCARIDDDLSSYHAGWLGEQNLAYYLSTLSGSACRILYDLRENVLEHTFQMDAFLFLENFALIIEAKNYSGTLTFEPSGRQMIRTLGNKRSGFSNPLIQVARHRQLLLAWLNDHGLPRIPLETLVTFSNPATIIENPGRSRDVAERVLHTEQVISKIQILEKKYQNSSRITDEVPHIGSMLIKEHTDPPHDTLTKYHIPFETLQRGVRCPRCHLYTMNRIYAAWACRCCGHSSRTAHIPMLLDYFLLRGATITNKQARNWLRLDDRQIIKYLLKKMGLRPKGSGTGSGLYYESPTYEWIDQYYQSIKRNF